MTNKRGRGGVGGGGASTSTSFTPLTDLVPASIPYTAQAQETLELLRKGQDPGIDALLRALNCGAACEAAGAPYSAKCGCRSAAAAGGGGASTSFAAAAARGAGGGAAPRCVRGLAPPPGSHRKVGLWAKPPKAEEEEEEEAEEAKEGGEKEEEEVRKTQRENIFFSFSTRGGEKKKKKLTSRKKNFFPQRTVPAGLFNLGATCYVAGALQCLFADPTFRRGLYGATGGRETDASQQRQPSADACAPAPSSSAPGGDAAVRALRRLFASMQAGSSASADPTPLVRALGLDAGEQQDGQEFFKLLLALLEERLGGGGDGSGLARAATTGASAPAPARSFSAPAPARSLGLVPSLFQGRSSIETICGLCSGRTSSSDRVEEFTELAVPVRGAGTLEQALASAAAPELLPGEFRLFLFFFLSSPSLYCFFLLSFSHALPEKPIPRSKQAATRERPTSTAIAAATLARPPPAALCSSTSLLDSASPSRGSSSTCNRWRGRK